MAPPIRNIADAPPGGISATPKRVLNRLAIRSLKVRGVVGRGRGRRGK